MWDLNVFRSGESLSILLCLFIDRRIYFDHRRPFWNWFEIYKRSRFFQSSHRFYWYFRNCIQWIFRCLKIWGRVNIWKLFLESLVHCTIYSLKLSDHEILWLISSLCGWEARRSGLHLSSRSNLNSKFFVIFIN